jgi:hypothetical protein
MADEGAEELLAGAGGGPFDDGLEGAEVVAPRRGGDRTASAGRRLVRFLKHGRGAARLVGHAAPPGPTGADGNLSVEEVSGGHVSPDYCIGLTKPGKTASVSIIQALAGLSLEATGVTDKPARRSFFGRRELY